MNVFIPVIIDPKVDPEIQVEGIGILDNLLFDKFDFCKLANSFDLFQFIKRQLNQTDNGSKETNINENDDIILEIINLIGTMCIDENIIPMMIQHQIHESLLSYMVLKEEDDEIILQILYCMHRLLSNTSCRHIIIEETGKSLILRK